MAPTGGDSHAAAQPMERRLASRAFFAQYGTDLSQDIETSLIWRQLLSSRWVDSALAARTLAEILEERLSTAVQPSRAAGPGPPAANSPAPPPR